MAYQAKTRPTAADVDAFIAAAQPLARAEDGRVLCDLMRKVSGEPPVMWGPTIVGFGERHYSYADGSPAMMCRLGFSPRKASLVLYLPHGADHDALMSRLGKHVSGRGCLYIRRLADVDIQVLEALIGSAWEAGADAGGC